MSLDENSDKAIGEAPARPQATAVTLLVVSTPRYPNDILFFSAMDELLSRYHVARVVAEEGSSVAHLARHWCDHYRIKFVLLLRDPALAPRDDRARRYALMAEMKPHAALAFNQFDHFLEWGKVMHAAGIPVNMVHADQRNSPHWLEWQPGHSVPQTPQLRDILQDARRRRGPRERKSEEHKKQVKAECTRRFDEKRRMLKMMKRLQDGTLAEHAWRFRKRKPRAITHAGHRPTML